MGALYAFTTDSGGIGFSDRPPADRPYKVCTWNGTVGELVCETPEEKAARVAAAHEARRDADRAERQREENAKKKAEAECEEGLCKENDRIREAARAREDAAWKRWSDARMRTFEARNAVTEQLAELDNLREWHSTFHNTAGLVIDVGGWVAKRNPWVFVGSLVLGVANDVIQGNYGSAAAGAFADGTEELAEQAVEAARQADNLTEAARLGRGIVALRGTVLVKDIGELTGLIGDPAAYGFSTPQSLAATEQIRAHFAKDPRTWVEKGFGPSLEELDGKFEDLIDAQNEEVAAEEELAEALEQRRKNERLTHEEGDWIRARMRQLLGMR